MRSLSSLLVVASLFLLFLLSCDNDGHQTTSQFPHNDSGTIVAIGDSLTAGYGVPSTQAYPAQLERRLQADGHHYRVVNAGVSGETSSGTLSRIDWIVNALQPDIVIIASGGNDGLRATSTELLKKNLKAILKALEQRGIIIIFCGMRMLPNLGPYYRPDFEAVYPSIAKRYPVLFVPFLLEGVVGERSLIQNDGIHPTAEGYTVVVEHLYPYVLQAIHLLEEKQRQHKKEKAVKEGQKGGLVLKT